MTIEGSQAEHREDGISCSEPSTRLETAPDFWRESATDGAVVGSARTSPSASIADFDSVDMDDIPMDDELLNFANLFDDGRSVHFNDFDVLAQRGSLANNHPGNQWYLRQKKLLQPSYFAASNKQQKTKIAKELVRKVHQRGGKFLRLNKRTSNWYELDAKTAHSKASQALREYLTADDMKKKRLKYPKKKGS